MKKYLEYASFIMFLLLQFAKHLSQPVPAILRLPWTMSRVKKLRCHNCRSTGSRPKTHLRILHNGDDPIHPLAYFPNLINKTNGLSNPSPLPILSPSAHPIILSSRCPMLSPPILSAPSPTNSPSFLLDPAPPPPPPGFGALPRLSPLPPPPPLVRDLELE
jgi:hypothetical protein